MLKVESIILLLVCQLALQPECLGQRNLAEKLGYDHDAKLLIIHADDMGVAHAENAATIKAMDEGSVNSASVMMPCSWAHETAEYAVQNAGDHDIGLHLTVTCEWDTYKWGPVAPKDDVPSLTDEFGYFHPDCSPYAEDAQIGEIEKEVRAQIELARQMSIDPTHLDSHMGCLFYVNPQVFELYVKLAREYKLPCLIGRQFASLYPEEFERIVTDQDVVVDQIYSASPRDFDQGMADFYLRCLRNINPGLNEIIIHAAYDNAEMQAVTVNHPDWGAAWRQADFDFFTSQECKDVIKEENIQMVTWRQIREVMYGY